MRVRVRHAFMSNTCYVCPVRPWRHQSRIAPGMIRPLLPSLIGMDASILLPKLNAILRMPFHSFQACTDPGLPKLCHVPGANESDTCP